MAATFARKGGAFEMVQLWVNLPKKDKLTPPRYQGILDAQIPKVPLGSAGSTARIIAGELDGKTGPSADLHADERVGPACRGVGATRSSRGHSPRCSSCAARS
jgi:redox-sensitive bicupin YhaK (pirin superfamily)